MREKLKNNDGYLLLEVLLAAAILAGGLLIAMRAMSAAASAESAADDRTRALLLLSEKSSEFAELNAADIAGILPAKGEFGKRAEDFEWTAERLSAPDLKGEWIKVSVLWERDKKKMSVDASLMVAPSRKPGQPNVE